MLYYCYKFGKWLALTLPIKVGYKFASFAAYVYYLFAKSDKIGMRENLSIVLGTGDQKLINKHIKNVFKNFAKYLIDFFRFSKINKEYIDEFVSFEGKENLDKVLAKGKGGILLSAHLGNWELGGAVVGSAGYSLYAIVLDHKDKRINDLFLNQRSMCGVTVISIGVQLRNCFKILRENNFLAIAGDRDFSNHGTEVDFFRHPTVLPRGPAFFSLRTGAPIVPTFLVRKPDDTFKMYFGEPIEPENTGDSKKDLKNIMKKYIAVIEKHIASYPDQWYAFKKVW